MVNEGRNSHENKEDVFALFVGHVHTKDYVNNFERFLLNYKRKQDIFALDLPRARSSGIEWLCRIKRVLRIHKKYV